MNWNFVLKIIGLVDPIVFLMEHRMLHGIRDLAEKLTPLAIVSK